MTTIVEKSRRRVFDSKLRSEREYWVERLARPNGISNLRLDYDRAANYTHDRETIAITTLGGLTSRLVEVTNSSPLLIYSVLTAVLNVCLQKYTGSESIAVGSPARLGGNGDMQAPNALVIVSHLDIEEPFKQLLFRTRITLLEAYARQDYPFTNLAGDLGLEESETRCPFFDIAVALRGFHTDLPELKNDITLQFSTSSQGLSGEIVFNPGLFRRETIGRFASHYQTLLQRALTNVESRLLDLEMVGEEERQLIFSWNDTHTEFPRGRRIHELFEEEAAQSPDAIAVSWAEDQITYGELNGRSNRVANYLRKFGIGPESVVGVMMERSVELIIAIFSILKEGAVYLPLDPEYPRRRLDFMVSDAKARLILTRSRLLAEIPQIDIPYIDLDAQWEAISEQDEREWLPAMSGENAAYVIYTSGSTGQPKGVCVKHDGVCNLVTAQNKAFNINRGSRVFQFAPLGFDASLSEIFTALTAGAVLDLGDPAAINAGPELLQQLRERDITTITLPPALLSTMLDDNLASLQTVISAGEVCTPALVERWSVGRRFINAYGPTESAVCASLRVCDERGHRVPPIGRPIANTRIYVVDEMMRLAPVGVAGELCIGGIGLARGYVNSPELTGDKFVPDPFNGARGERLYRTGDLARYLPNGEIEFLGRIDRQVKLRGYRIEPLEIEATLQNHPSLKGSLVFVPKDGVWKGHLLAYIIPAQRNDSNGAEIVSASELRRYLAERLPEFMIPSTFVVIDEVPLTHNGKVDWQRLPSPGPQSTSLADEFVAPRTPTEQLIASIWAEVLKIERVGVTDNFFSLGGYSLLVVEVSRQLQEMLKVELPLRLLFENPTVAAMAPIVDAAQNRELNKYEEVAFDLNAEAELDPSIYPECVFRP
jgi:amino acid adenylation domain-containing protein